MRDPIRGATRIYADPETTSTSARALAPDSKPKAPDSYLTTLLKLIPSEIVAGYVAVATLWQAKGELVTWFWLCMLTCFLLRAYSSLPKDKPASLAQVQWSAVLITCVAFYLWASTVYTPGDGANAPRALTVVPSWLHWFVFEPWKAGGIGLLFSVLAAAFVPKDQQTT